MDISGPQVQSAGSYSFLGEKKETTAFYSAANGEG
jgi:hypothetical protein